jgi:glycosyltransferase involved in cell wall biosynthesis
LRIGFLLLHPFTDSMASGVRTLELAKSLNKINVETIVFSPYVETHITKDGVKVVKVPSIFSSLHIENSIYNISRRFYYSRALQRLVIKSSNHLLGRGSQLTNGLPEFFKKFNLDIIQAEQDNAALTLLPIRSKLDVPLVLDLHGIWPEELLAAKAIEFNSSDWQDLQRLMQTILGDVDLTICLSELMNEYINSNYSVRKTAVVPPGGRILHEDYCERVGSPKIVYAGIVSYRKHVDLFVNSMNLIKISRPDVKFFITKKGDLLKKVQDLTMKLGVDPNFFWYPDYGDTLNFLLSCHIGVHPSTDDISAKISMPSKLFDYFSAGLPVVANDVGGWTDIVKENRVGRITSDDSKEFAQATIDLLEDPNEIIACGRRAMSLIANKYNWENSAKILKSHYERLL